MKNHKNKQRSLLSNLFSQIFKGLPSPDNSKLVSIFHNFCGFNPLIIVHTHGISIGACVLNTENITNLSADFNLCA